MPRPDYSDRPEALVAALARTGNQDAFAALVARRQAWIRSLMRRCCGDATLADDLAQQTFLQAWRDIGKLREPQRFAAWLKRIAINVWRQHARKHDPLFDADPEVEEPAPQLSEAGMARDLDRALQSLSGIARLCLVLAYQEGMSHGEIAALTDIPLGTVKSHIKRASERVQAQLSAYDEVMTGERSD